MREDDLDIVEIIINNMPTENEMQKRIKFYMQCHKNNCNNFIYTNYEREATILNNAFKVLRMDLGREICNVLNK